MQKHSGGVAEYRSSEGKDLAAVGTSKVVCSLSSLYAPLNVKKSTINIPPEMSNQTMPESDFVKLHQLFSSTNPLLGNKGSAQQILVIPDFPTPVFSTPWLLSCYTEQGLRRVEIWERLVQVVHGYNLMIKSLLKSVLSRPQARQWKSSTEVT